MLNENQTLLDLLLRYKQLIYIVVGLAVLLGVLALILMPRDEYPQFDVPLGLIVGIYPGATSEQVEEQLTTRVEKFLFQFKAVDRAKTYSISKANVMVIYVTTNQDEKDLNDFWAKLQHGLNSLKAELPAAVTSLTADNDFGNTSALLLAVQSESKSYNELEKYVNRYEDQVRKIASVAKVKRYGLQREQISVYMDDAKLANYGVRPLQVLAALKPPAVVSYAGDIDDGQLVRPIYVSSTLNSETDVANQIIHSDPAGNVLRVKDIGRVVREYEDPDSYIRVNGKKCVLVSLEMRAGKNIVSFGKEVSKVTDAFSRSLPADVHIITISNVPDAVSKAIGNFLKEFVISMVSVIVVTMLLLPARVARIAAMSIPTSIFMALGLMWICGMDLQTVSLAGLILVLGITVDDAIVVIDNYIEKLDQGMSCFKAGSKCVTELFSSVLSATLVIIICFLPMPFFMSGTAGDFIRSLPLTITFALLISLLISVTLIPLVSYTLIKTGIKDHKKTAGKPTFLERLQALYNNVLQKAFTYKKWVVTIGLISFVIGLALLAVIPRQSFPKIERNQFAVEIYLPEGSSLQQTDAVMKDLENILANDSRIKVVTSFVGTSSPRFHTLYSPNFAAKHYGQLVVLTESSDATVNILDEYSKRLYNHYPMADIKWKQLAFDIQKAPIEVRISGDSIRTMRQTADIIARHLRDIKGTEYVRTDYGQPSAILDLHIRKDQAAQLGYSTAVLENSLMVGIKGLPVSTVWEGDIPVEVKLKIDKKVKTSPQDIANLYVTSPLTGSSVPVRQLADIKPGWSEAEIVRRNGVRTMTVRAEVRRGLYPTAIFKRIRPIVDKMRLPEGVTIAYGGDYQDTQENMTPFYYSLAASITMIFLILMFQFKKTKTSLLIMATLPLSVFGAAVGVLLTGYPFGVTAFVGLIGLMGIVVRNGVIFISYADELRTQQGLSAEEAAMSAGRRRMRPIFLTSAAAAVGVIPMILSGSSLWGPLGAVICSGLFFALALSLLVLPVLYYYFHRNDTIAMKEGD